MEGKERTELPAGRRREILASLRPHCPSPVASTGSSGAAQFSSPVRAHSTKCQPPESASSTPKAAPFFVSENAKTPVAAPFFVDAASENRHPTSTPKAAPFFLGKGDLGSGKHADVNNSRTTCTTHATKSQKVPGSSTPVARISLFDIGSDVAADCGSSSSSCRSSSRSTAGVPVGSISTTTFTPDVAAYTHAHAQAREQAVKQRRLAA